MAASPALRHILVTEISLLSVRTKFLFEEKGKLSRREEKANEL
jgi:hypothetical protein